MITYVNTVLVSNLNGNVLLSSKPANASKLNTPSADAGKFILMNCDPNVAPNAIYAVNGNNIADIETIKVGIVTKKNATVRMNDGSVIFQPIVKWSNEIKKRDVRSLNKLEYANDSEDTVVIDFNGMDPIEASKFAEGGKRIIVRLTFKDMPHRYRKWTESYEYVTAIGDDKNKIAQGIANMINADWKRARVQATATGATVTLEALPYDDDDSVDSLNWANKVRFNANMYYTDPAAEGWEANNKHFLKGIVITKTPGVQYPASAKLVRDRESQAMGYLGILNRGEGTWPIIKPAMETDLANKYDAITLEFENMYRAADDIFRKTKQTVEIYSTQNTLDDLYDILNEFAYAAAIKDIEEANTRAAKDQQIDSNIANINSDIAAINQRLANAGI